MNEENIIGRLKFRVWDNAWGDYVKVAEMIQRTLPHEVRILEQSTMRNIEDFPDWKYRFAIESCTGIRDHLGTWIYAGDIVARGETFFVVAWHKDFAAFVIIPVEEMLRFMCKGNCSTFDLLSKAAAEINCSIGVGFSDCRVQGNIHTHRLFKEQQICRESGTEDAIQLSKGDLSHLIKALHTHINNETLIMHKTERDYRELNELCDLLHRLEDAHGGAGTDSEGT